MYIYVPSRKDQQLPSDTRLFEFSIACLFSFSNCSHSVTFMDRFSQRSKNDMHKFIESSAKKTCKRDPTPTAIVVNCIDLLYFLLSPKSLICHGYWLFAIVNPILQKGGLDLIFKNYRPITNLQYISKLKERAVSEQVHLHMKRTISTLYSSLRTENSTEYRNGFLEIYERYSNKNELIARYFTSKMDF